MEFNKFDEAREMLNELQQLNKALNMLQSDYDVVATINLSYTYHSVKGNRFHSEVNQIAVPKKIVKEFEKYVNERYEKLFQEIRKL